MQHLCYSLIVLLIGLIAVTFIDVAGSIVSRLLNFNYGYFSVLSFIAYISTGYMIAVKTNSTLLTMVVVMLVGLYDATAGWLIAKKLKANYKYSKEVFDNYTLAHRIFVCTLFSVLCGFLGYYMASQ